jgi:hypothetical protein
MTGLGRPTSEMSVASDFIATSIPARSSLDAAA